MKRTLEQLSQWHLISGVLSGMILLYAIRKQQMTLSIDELFEIVTKVIASPHTTITEHDMKKWFENAWWSWGNCISFRFIDYNDNIDRCAFFEELNAGWYRMKYEYHMSQPGFDFWNLAGRDLYYSYVMKNK